MNAGPLPEGSLPPAQPVTPQPQPEGLAQPTPATGLAPILANDMAELSTLFD